MINQIEKLESAIQGQVNLIAIGIFGFDPDITVSFNREYYRFDIKVGEYELNLSANQRGLDVSEYTKAAAPFLASLPIGIKDTKKIKPKVKSFSINVESDPRDYDKFDPSDIFEPHARFKAEGLVNMQFVEAFRDFMINKLGIEPKQSSKEVERVDNKEVDGIKWPGKHTVC